MAGKTMKKRARARPAAKLWGGEGLDPRVEDFTVGNDPVLDLRLLPYDCVASKVHARMLGKVGLLTAGEVKKLVAGLDEILRLARAGRFEIRREQEDCHTAIEQFLTARLGEVGRKIHLGRSRNDQVLTALRLFCKDSLRDIRAEVNGLARGLAAFGRRYRRVALPGYTHMRKAMPSSVALWAGALVDGLRDDDVLLAAAFRLVDQCPLGTGAGYGVPLPLDREMTARELGFARVQQNPIYAQLSRGKLEAAMLHALAQVMLDLNRAAADLVLFSMPEFGFFRLPPELCTGSSIMPQKRNPDVLELVRAKYHVVLACESQLRTMLANLPSGYHRDLQLTKEPLLRAIDCTRESLAAMALLFSRLEVDAAACRRGLTDDLYATQRAYRLVQEEGVSFREAYARVKDRLEP
jgi:argininosuccinate lyase